MFFLLRSAACIGVVFCMLPGSGGSGELRDIAADSGRLAMGQAQRYCAANRGCLEAGARLAAAALSGPRDADRLAPAMLARTPVSMPATLKAGTANVRARPKAAS